MPVEPAAPERARELSDNYDDILRQVDGAAARRTEGPKPRLVAVSKYKPASDILALYEHGVRHFGENYPQELEGKAKELPSDIAWHFIGALQSNKAKLLAAIPNLFAVETLTSVKAANHLHNALSSAPSPRSNPLNVFLQVNTSGEEQKSGLPALSPSTPSGGLVDLALHVVQKCPTLRLKGLMTIGSFEASTSGERNPDFERLKESREALVAALRERAGADAVRALEADGGLELSMGMSNDFAEAIEQGSTNVRVGSSIFGARPPKA
ncbi:pyridoxal phosphate homeostasis protein [Rhodotorula paludigena]|uniref:pyridoxal phosphate homeostasis protein n=1 Tax=Rhodotorula paludigena TaxID=86838 RepID=UPI003170B97A